MINTASQRRTNQKLMELALGRVVTHGFSFRLQPKVSGVRLSKSRDLSVMVGVVRREN